MEDPDREARDALNSWRVGRLQSELAAAPDGLWHYTDGVGLQGILTRDELWATDTRFLNDSTEINYGLEMAEEAVEAATSSGLWKQPTTHFLRRVMATDGANLTGFLRARSEVYVACFCEEGDLLSQWRAYAGRDSAGGYALKFQHRSPMTGWIDHLGRGTLRLQRVMYDRGDQLAAFNDLIAALAPIYDLHHSEQRMNALTQTLVDGILELATLCKHPSFQEEREWRVVYERSSDSNPLPLQHRASHGLLVPYVSLALPAAVGAMAGHLPVVEVCCGPSPDPELKQVGVWRQLRSLSAFSGLAISGSQSPLRL